MSAGAECRLPTLIFTQPPTKGDSVTAGRRILREVCKPRRFPSTFIHACIGESKKISVSLTFFNFLINWKKL